MNKAKSKLKWIIIAVIVIVLIGGAAYNSATKSIPVKGDKVVKGEMSAFIEEKGRTTIPHIYHVTMPMQGRVMPIELSEGDLVKKDQVIARLDDNDLQDAKKEAMEMVAALNNTLTAMAAKLEIDKAAINFSKWIWEAKSKLYTDNQLSEIEEKKAYRDYFIDKGSLEKDQALKAACAAMQSIAGLMPIYVNRQLKRTTLTAPSDGVVLRRYVWNKRFMQPGDQLLDIGDLSTMEITADILTEQAVKIKEDCPVLIYGETIGEKPLSGIVRKVEPMGFTKLSSLGVEQQRVPVRVKFDSEEYSQWLEKGKTLGLGFRVQVKIITDNKKNTLMIPRTALFRNDKREWQAYMVKKGRAELTTLKLGLINDEHAEVLSGLAEGDSVIIAPDTSITTGTRVSIVH